MHHERLELLASGQDNLDSSFCLFHDSHIGRVEVKVSRRTNAFTFRSLVKLIIVRLRDMLDKQVYVVRLLKKKTATASRSSVCCGSD